MRNPSRPFTRCMLAGIVALLPLGGAAIGIVWLENAIASSWRGVAGADWSRRVFAQGAATPIVCHMRGKSATPSRAGHHLVSRVAARLASGLVLLAPMAVGQATFTNKATLGPRRAHGMVFDSLRQRVMVFGGTTGRPGGWSTLGESWEWDGTTWSSRESPVGARRSMSMTWDSARRRVVLFGGRTDGTYQVFGDTWEWDGAAWLSRGSTGPRQSAGNAMVFDAARQRTVLFGGFTYAGAAMNETWEWDGTAWTQRIGSPAPPARHMHAMVYDAARQRVVLFGGTDDAYGSNALGDTWEWDGSTWMRRTPANAPRPRFAHAMAYDPAHGGSLLFGGEDTFAELGDTWSWDGTNWRQHLSLRAPAPRGGHAMVFDSSGGRVLLLGGGQSVRNDFWQWDGSAWSELPAQSPWFRLEHAMAWDPVHQRVLCFGGAVRSASLSPSLLDDTWHWDGGRWAQLFPTVAPLARQSHAMATDTARGGVVLFGGFRNYSSLLGDTWVWDGATWTERASSTAPSPRHQAAMAFDAARGRMILFGGAAATSNANGLGDTWEWDGLAWLRRSPPQSPAPRLEHAMAYDAARQRVVLHGGHDYQQPRDDTWEWDGTTWSLRSVTGPKLRWGHVLVYDSARRRVIALGGMTDNWQNPSAWEWDGTTWTMGLGRFERLGHGAAYDEVRRRCVLFSGETWGQSGGSALHGDVWVYAVTTPARAASLGVGCAGAIGVPQMTNVGNAVLATAFRLDVVNAQPGALVIVPFTRTSADIPLPGGCRLRADPTSLVVAPYVAADANGFATVRLTIPSEPSLAGLGLFAQGVVVESSLRLVVTGALQLTVGD